MAYRLKVNEDRVSQFLRDFAGLSREGRIRLFANFASRPPHARRPLSQRTSDKTQPRLGIFLAPHRFEGRSRRRTAPSVLVHRQ